MHNEEHSTSHIRIHIFQWVNPVMSRWICEHCTREHWALRNKKSASAWLAVFVLYESALSASNSSGTWSPDTCSFSKVSFIKNRKKPSPWEWPKVFILYKLQAYSPTVLAAMTRKISAQNTAKSDQFISFEKTKRYIQKSKKSQLAGFGHMYAAYLFFSLKLPIFSVLEFKFSHKSFALYFN